MRKTTRIPPPKLSRLRALRLSRESIRTLTETEIPLIASGCPTGSWPTINDTQRATLAC